MEFALTSVSCVEAAANGPAILDRRAGSAMICRANAKAICNAGEQPMIGQNSAMLILGKARHHFPGKSSRLLW
jgi:hypothetical protein